MTGVKQTTILVKNLILFNEASKILKKFSQNNLKVIVLKGFALSKKIKLDPLKREQTDIDFLIKKKDFKKIRTILEKQGYKLDFEPLKGIKGVRFYYDKRCCNLKYNLQKWDEISFSKKIKNLKIIIEIHLVAFLSPEWIFKLGKQRISILPLSKRKKITNDFFKRALRFPRDKPTKSQPPYWTLSNNDTLIYLCLHAFFHHSCRGPRLLKEIAKFTKADRVDWQTVKKRAKIYKIEKFIYYPLKLSYKMFGAKIPKKILSELKPKSFFAKFVPLFINQKSVYHPRNHYDQVIKGKKEQIILQFLLLDKPFFWKLRYLTKSFALIKHRRLITFLLKPR